MNVALTINGDGAQRNPDIHWPKGQQPEDADLYAHNEIMVNASCEIVFANIVDAQSWPSWYPNSHNVDLPGRNGRDQFDGLKYLPMLVDQPSRHNCFSSACLSNVQRWSPVSPWTATAAGCR